MSTCVESDLMCVGGEAFSDHADHGAHWCQQWWICGCLGFTPAQAKERSGGDEDVSAVEPGLGHSIENPVQKVN